MDLQHAFADLTPQDPAFEQRVRKAIGTLSPSKHPLGKLRRSIRINLVFAIVITLGMILLMTQVTDGVVLALMTILLAFNVWAIGTTLRLYRSLPDHIPAEHTVLHLLRQHAEAIAHWMFAQKRVALFVYPVAGTGGFLMGGAAGSGLSPSAVMDRPHMWLILLVTLLVLVPLSNWLGSWMTRIAFGGHLKELRARIEELEA